MANGGLACDLARHQATSFRQHRACANGGAMKTLFKHELTGVAIGLSLGAALQFGAGATPQPPPGQAGRGRGFTEPAPIDFNDHEGYGRRFDGVSLKGWVGTPNFWRVGEGAIVGG